MLNTHQTPFEEQLELTLREIGYELTGPKYVRERLGCDDEQDDLVIMRQRIAQAKDIKVEYLLKMFEPASEVQRLQHAPPAELEERIAQSLARGEMSEIATVSVYGKHEKSDLQVLRGMGEDIYTWKDAYELSANDTTFQQSGIRGNWPYDAKNMASLIVDAIRKAELGCTKTM